MRINGSPPSATGDTQNSWRRACRKMRARFEWRRGQRSLALAVVPPTTLLRATDDDDDGDRRRRACRGHRSRRRCCRRRCCCRCCRCVCLRRCVCTLAERSEMQRRATAAAFCRLAAAAARVFTDGRRRPADRPPRQQAAAKAMTMATFCRI